jgi:4-diphosphocytidyl-2-C-methyl-D-erythritol kinase
VYSLTAPAKINLALEILDDLPQGYHRIDTVFATLDLVDELRWGDAAQTRLRLSGDLSGMKISEGDDNLVLRALRALESASGRTIPLDIQLIKRIPAGGGLGGGSADAAALLYGVNRSHQLNLTLDQLRQLAAPLGADVAFGVSGGVARGTGKGDQLTVLPAPPSRPILLICPPFFCPTGAVYQAWDISRPGPARGRVERLIGELQQQRWGPLEEILGNDLEAAAHQVQPQLADISTALRQRGWGPVLLCGSGSTLSCWGNLDVQEVTQVVSAWGCRVVATRVTGERRL